MYTCKTIYAYKYRRSYNCRYSDWLLCFQLLFYITTSLHRERNALSMVDQRTSNIFDLTYLLVNSKPVPQKILYLFNNFMYIVLSIPILNNKVQITYKYFTNNYK